MSINIPTHFVQQFSTNIALLLQQRGSKLRDSVMSQTHVGKQASPVDQIGAVAATKVTSRYQPMARVDAPTDRRWVFPVDYDLPQLIDSFDRLRLITDPNSSYVLNGTYAMGRAMDDEIIAAYFGTAQTGEQGGTATPFPAAQQIAETFGAAGAVGLTVKKLLEAKRILMANEVDLDNDMMFCIVTAEQHDNLLNEIQIVNRDYNDTPVLVNAKLKSWGGFNFIHTERLLTDGSGFRRVPAYVKTGMHMGIWGDIETDVDRRKDLQGMPWQAYASGTFGATRIEEGKIVEIKCDES